MNLTHAMDQIGAVRRELTSLDHRGRPARALTAEQTYATSAEDVWDALTRPERLSRWSNWEVLNPSMEYTQLDASTIEFRVEVPPGGETVVTYTVRYTWPN